MSFPTEADFALIKIGDGAEPTENFVVLCGIENVQINRAANTSDRYRRDCAKPGSVPSRKVKVTGRSWTVTGSGIANVDQIALLNTNLGIARNIEIDLGIRDGTDAGQIIGTYSGEGVLTTDNKNFSTEEGTAEITIEGNDELTWTPAA